MADLSKVKQHAEVIGADGVHVGTVAEVVGNRIKLTLPDSGLGTHKGHHHYISGGLVAEVEDGTVTGYAQSCDLPANTCAKSSS